MVLSSSYELLCMLSHSALSTTLLGIACSGSHFIDEETKHREVKQFAQHHTVNSAKAGFNVGL